MAVQLSTTVRNARLDVIETTIGASPILRLRSGTPPTNCASADTGTVIATMTLPADWLSAASAGSKAKAGTWQDASADASGTIGHFRIYDSGGVTCHWQGTCTATGGGGDMTLDNNVVTSGQTITVVTFTATDANQ
jgi:hypothetical protein